MREISEINLFQKVHTKQSPKSPFSAQLRWGKQSLRLSTAGIRSPGRSPDPLSKQHDQRQEESKTANRKRNKTLTIRLTPEEWTKLMEGTLHAGLNVTEYILSLADSAVINPPPDLSPLLTQLKRIGNNLNQIAAKVNSGAAYAPGLREVAALQRELLDQLLRMTKEGTWQP